MGRGGSGRGGGFRSAPRARAPAPAKPAAAPAPAALSNNGGLMGSVVSSVVQGLTWGAGISLGHRIVDFFGGPRTIRVVEAPPAPPSGRSPAAAADACSIHNQAFADCIGHNGSDISRCQFYVDLLNQCRRGGSNAGIAAAVSIA